MLGTTLVGRYQIISHLGGGGFGDTYIAHDIHLPGSPECVVKQLKLQSTNLTTLETMRRLFDTEAQVLYKLGTHDRIPQLLAYFEENAQFYLVQEFIVGHDLSQELTLGKILPQEQVVTLLQEILEILDFVHQQHVIHRDVNPRNILRRTADSKLILIDFGAVKQITTQFIVPPGQTKFTVAIGTPGYIPSEQAQGNPKLSSDIYALGIVAIQALTGLSPDEMLKDPQTNEIVWRHLSTVSPEFAQFIDQMVCYDFRQRHASATIALKALEELFQPMRTIALAPATPLHHLPKPQLKKGIFSKLVLSLFFIGFSSIITIFIFHHINHHHAQELSIQGNTFLQLQRYRDALAVYEQAVNLKPNYAPGWYGKGKALWELKQYLLALSAFDQAIQIQPNYLEAWTARGFTLVGLKRYPEAISAFDRVLQLKHNSPDIWYAKGDVFRKIGQYDQAIKAYEQVIDLQANNYAAWYKKGMSFQDLKRYDEAITAYNKTIDLKADDELVWYNLGNCFVNLNRYEDAFKAYDKAVQYKPNDSLAWLSRSNVLMTLRRYPEAVDSFRQIAKDHPNNYEVWYNLGWALHQNQQYLAAIEADKKAISLRRNDYLVWYNLGNSEYSLQKYLDAIASYSRAVHYKPSHYESWYSRGNAFLNLQKYPEAIFSYEQAIKYKPDDQQAINALNQAQSQLKSHMNIP